MSAIVPSCGRIANRALRSFGIRVTRAVADPMFAPSQDTLPAALNRLAALNLNIQTIIDVGASDGSWSRMARQSLPETSILAFEPLQERWPAIESWQADDSRIHLVKGVAGDQPGSVSFHVADDLDGSGISESSENGRTVPVSTIDDEVAARGLYGPFLIKLDTHGYEVPILNAATETLKQAQALVIEVYNFKLTADSLLFHEMCAHLAPLGFRCYDMFDLLRRPSDNTLWQADFVFLRNNHLVFKNTNYA